MLITLNDIIIWMERGQDNSKITAKILYIKLLFIVDKEKNKPVFKRMLRRSGEEFPIYDSSVFYQFTQFGPNKPDVHEWKFTSSKGQVEAMQIYPFDSATFLADPAKRKIHNLADGATKLDNINSLLVVCHNYNGFQKGEDGEWAGVRAANTTDLLRLIVDFSSVTTIPNEKLFLTEPKAYHEEYFKKTTTEIPSDFNDGKIIVISKKNVAVRDVIKIEYKMNWNGLATLHSFDQENEYVPKDIVDYEYKQPF